MRLAQRERMPILSSRAAFFLKESRMKIQFAAIAGLALAATMPSAVAASASGHSALALGALVGSYSTVLTSHDKAVLAGLLDAKAVGAVSGPIAVRAGAVVCHAGDVDIAAFACELTFGAKMIQLTGRRANELFATAGAAGVPPDGAAGILYEALHALDCVIDPAGIARKDGGGATCSFDAGPP